MERGKNKGHAAGNSAQVLAAAVLLIFIWTVPVNASSDEGDRVKNLVTRMEGNRVLSTYDLAGEGEAEVSVTLTVQGRTYQSSELHLTGDFGKVMPGPGKKIYWNVLQDFPKGLRDPNAKMAVTAGGGPVFTNPTLGAKLVLKGLRDPNAKMAVTASGGPVFTSPVLGAKFILVPAGMFTMGSGKDGEPLHQVIITMPFYIQTTEVTQGQWERVMGNNPSAFSSCGSGCPVEMVSWNDVQEFIREINRMEGTDKYRLPTEAEWEYAARSRGRAEEYSGGDDIDAVAWYRSNSRGKTHPVGQKRPNGLGI